MSIAETYAQNFWQIANVTAGFAIAQVLVVILAMGTSSHFEARVHKYRIPAMELIVGALGGVVRLCHGEEMALLPPCQETEAIRHMVHQLRWAELAAIFVFGVLLLFVIGNASSQSGRQWITAAPRFRDAQ